MPNLDFLPRSAFAAAPLAAAPAAGEVFMRDRDGLGLATVLPRNRQHAALAARVRQLWGIELPSGPRRVESEGVAFIGIGPDAWLASCEGQPNIFAAELREALTGLASVSDQSDGYAPLRVSGSKARETLLKLVPVDLDPRAFGIGAVASTLAAHIGVTLWRLEDDAQGSAVFELVVFRSLAASLQHALSEAASQFGLVIQPSTGQYRATLAPIGATTDLYPGSADVEHLQGQLIK